MAKGIISMSSARDVLPMSGGSSTMHKPMQCDDIAREFQLCKSLLSASASRLLEESGFRDDTPVH